MNTIKSITEKKGIVFLSVVVGDVEIDLSNIALFHRTDFLENGGAVELYGFEIRPQDYANVLRLIAGEIPE